MNIRHFHDLKLYLLSPAYLKIAQPRLIEFGNLKFLCAPVKGVRKSPVVFDFNKSPNLRLDLDEAPLAFPGLIALGLKPTQARVRIGYTVVTVQPRVAVSGSPWTIRRSGHRRSLCC